MPHMEVFIVNLARRTDRKQRFTAWNGRPGLTLNFQSAVDGALLSRDALRAEGVLGDDHEHFTNGAIGNALSHRALWRRATVSGQPVLICEDDCCLRGDFVEAVSGVMGRLPAQWDVVFLGYNTNATMAVETSEGLKTILYFDASAKQQPNYYDDYSRNGKGMGPSTLTRCFQRWGTLCYLVSPRGGERLERYCFPLSTQTKVFIYGQNRAIRTDGLDGMMNLAQQRHEFDAYAVFPPLALSENSSHDSDVLRSSAGASQLSGVGVAES
jgi:GR25 family glycosyltransferase involved in LPS biosynthesis